MNIFLKELKERGLISQITNEEELSKLLNEGVSLYCGFDPTAESLHVGSLLPLITLLRFKKEGHRVFPLIGGATGMIGDPSGKSQERNLNNEDTVIKFKVGISNQIRSIIGEDCKVVDNFTWTKNINIIEFLRDIGKHFSVNSMLNKESVKNRIERDDQGISFTEFTYQLLQSMDFWHLNKEFNCKLQIGGSDQWGNITSGIDLIHRKEGNEKIAVGMTIPLLVKSDGTKFGKSESGTVWLSSEKTRPFDFFQFWLKVSDADIPSFFKMLSLRSVEEIDRILEEDKHRNKPMAQQFLAEELTELVHGRNALDSVLRITKALFDNNFNDLEECDFDSLEKDGMLTFELIENKNLISILTESGLSSSNKKSREFIKSGAVSLNGKKLETLDSEDIFDLEIKEFFFNKYAILKRGKREFRLIKK